MYLDSVVVVIVFQKVDCFEDGYVVIEVWCEIGNDLVNVQCFVLSVVLQRLIGIELLGFKLDDFFEFVDFDFVVIFDN